MEEQGLAEWLSAQGLGAFAAAFAEAGVDLGLLPHLTEGDLAGLGLSLGQRRRFFLGLAQAGQAAAGAEAERRHITVMFCDIVGYTVLAGAHDPEDVAAMLRGFYGCVDQVAEMYGGHVASYLGDGVLVYFGYPVPLEDAACRSVEAAVALHQAVRTIRLPGGQGIVLRSGISSGLTVVGELPLGGQAGPGKAVGATVNLAARIQALAPPEAIYLARETAGLVKWRWPLRSVGAQLMKGFAEPMEVFALDGAGAGLNPDAGRMTFVNRSAETGQLLRLWARVRAGEGQAVQLHGEAGIGKSRLLQQVCDRIAAEGGRIRRFACSPRNREAAFQPFIESIRAGENPDEQELLARLTAAGPGEERRRAAFIADLSAHLLRHHDVLVVEDLHWADPSSQEVVTRLVEHCGGQGCLVVVSCRGRQDLLAQALEIRPLDAGHTEAMIRNCLSGPAASEGLVQRLVMRAEGVPIFAEALARDMSERDGAAAGGQVPATLKESLEARIGRLGAGRKLLRIAACHGRETPLLLLRELAGSEAIVTQGLAELEAAGLADVPGGRTPGGQPMPDQAVLVIRHQLILETAYDMILHRDRRAFHRQIAAQLQGVADPHLIAQQFELADQPRLAAEHWAQAGRQSVQRLAYPEAVILFRRGLGLIAQEADAEWQRRFEADTLLAMIPALISAEGYGAASADVLDRITLLSQQLGDPQRLFSAMFFQWIKLTVSGEIDSAHDFGLHLADMAAADASGVLHLMVQRMLGSTHMFRGELHPARTVLQDFLARYQPDRHAEGLRGFGATDNHATVLSCLSAIVGLDGDRAALGRAMAATRAAGEASGHPNTQCQCIAYGCALPLAMVQDREALAEVAAQLRRLADQHGLPYWLLICQMIDAILLAGRGEVAEGLALLQAAVARVSASGVRFMLPTWQVLFAYAEHPGPKAGRIGPDPAALLADVQQGERWMLPICQRML